MPARVVFFLVVSILPLQESEQPDLKRRVDALVQQLDSDLFADRKAAREEILRIGPDAIPFLVDGKNDSVQIQLELKSIREKLRNQRAVGSLVASRVNLTGRLTLDQIVDRITEQTGNAVSVARLPSAVRGRRIHVDFKETEFWKAIGNLSARLGLRGRASEGAVRLTVGEQPDTSLSGSYRVLLGEVTRKNLVGDSENQLLRLPLTFGAEPRLRGLFAKALGSGIAVTTEARRQLVPYSVDQKLELAIGGRGEDVSWTHDVLLPAGAKVDTINIRGKIEVLMAGGYEAFEFRNLNIARRARKSRTGVDIVINNVELDEARGDLELTMTVHWKRSIGAFDSYRTWQFHNEAFLRTPAGERIDFAGPLRTDGQAGGGVRLTYHFKGVAENLHDCTFIYEAPTALETVSVPFTFNNIQVPN